MLTVDKQKKKYYLSMQNNTYQNTHIKCMKKEKESIINNNHLKMGLETSELLFRNLTKGAEDTEG